MSGKGRYSEHPNQGCDYAICIKLWNSIESDPINDSAIETYATSLSDTKLAKNEKIADLLRAISCLDLTSLNAVDTNNVVGELCKKAVNPIPSNLLVKLEKDPKEIHTAAVCVYPARVSDCVQMLSTLNSDMPVAAVAAGFPSGQYHMESRLLEIELCIRDGAKEIDIVIRRDLVLQGKWEELYDQVKQMKKACGNKAILKAIIAAGELGSNSNIYKASVVCMAAGADFIKTSTGKEAVNATIPIGVIMTRAIRDYHQETGFEVGFKPAGGIRTSTDVFTWQALMKKQLGNKWLHPNLFRIGASSLLGDIVENINQLV